MSLRGAFEAAKRRKLLFSRSRLVSKKTKKKMERRTLENLNSCRFGCKLEESKVYVLVFNGYGLCPKSVVGVTHCVTR